MVLLWRDGEHRRLTGAAAALAKADKARKHKRRPKCFTCRDPGWVQFVAESVALGATYTTILEVLRNPEKYDQTFPPYEWGISTLMNHIWREHENDS